MGGCEGPKRGKFCLPAPDCPGLPRIRRSRRYGTRPNFPNFRFSRSNMQLRAICKSKIHHGRVTETHLEYIGSVAIDSDLLERSDILPGEKVHIWNMNNGQRLETYALPAPAGSGSIIVNGASARLCSPGDVVIIVAFTLTDEVIKPKMILVDKNNRFVEELRDNRMPEGMDVDMLSPAPES